MGSWRPSQQLHWGVESTTKTKKIPLAYTSLLPLVQPDAGDQAQPRGGILAGDDSSLRMTSYPTDQEEPMDLCLSASVSASAWSSYNPCLNPVWQLLGSLCSDACPQAQGHVLHAESNAGQLQGCRKPPMGLVCMLARQITSMHVKPSLSELEGQQAERHHRSYYSMLAGYAGS